MGAQTDEKKIIKFAVTVTEASEMLGTYPKQIRKMVESGDLDMVKVGSRKIVVKSIERFIEANKTNEWGASH